MNEKIKNTDEITICSKNTDEIIICPKCKGRGYLKMEKAESTFSGFVDYRFIKCDFCNGLGRVREIVNTTIKYNKIETDKYEFDELPINEENEWTVAFSTNDELDRIQYLCKVNKIKEERKKEIEEAEQRFNETQSVIDLWPEWKRKIHWISIVRKDGK